MLRGPVLCLVQGTVAKWMDFTGFLQKSGAVCWSHIFLLISTCDSFSPKLMASFFRSVLLIYFCFWNIFSRAFLWSSEKTALLKMPLRALEVDSWVRRGSTLSSPRGEKIIQKAPLALGGEFHSYSPEPYPPPLCHGQIISSLNSAHAECFLTSFWSWTPLRIW